MVKSDTILTIAIIGGVAYFVYKSGILKTIGDVGEGIGSATGGAGELISEAGNLVGGAFGGGASILRGIGNVGQNFTEGLNQGIANIPRSVGQAIPNALNTGFSPFQTTKLIQEFLTTQFSPNTKPSQTSTTPTNQTPAPSSVLRASSNSTTASRSPGSSNIITAITGKSQAPTPIEKALNQSLAGESDLSSSPTPKKSIFRTILTNPLGFWK